MDAHSLFFTADVYSGNLLDGNLEDFLNRIFDLDLIGILCYLKGLFLISNSRHALFGYDRSYNYVFVGLHYAYTSSILATAPLTMTSVSAFTMS